MRRKKKKQLIPLPDRRRVERIALWPEGKVPEMETHQRAVRLVRVDASACTVEWDNGALVSFTNATELIQKAIDDVYFSGGGRVVVGRGFYPIRGLRLRSHVTLHLEKGAVLQASRRAEDFDILGEDKVEPVSKEAYQKARKLRLSAAALSAFGEDLTIHSPTPTRNSNFYTGKPYVEGLGHAFLMRNYRAGLAKWQTADPIGYPDGWNQLAYCRNGVANTIDLYGGKLCVFPGSVNELTYEVDVHPLIESAMYNGFEYSLSIWWTCNHDFDNTVISSNIEIAEGSMNMVHWYTQDGMCT